MRGLKIFLRCNQTINISQCYYKENVWIKFTCALRTWILYDEYLKLNIKLNKLIYCYLYLLI